MAKIVKAWVQTHERVDGIKYYTAHVTFKMTILWFIPYYYVYHLCQLWSKTSEQPAMYALCSNNSYHDPYKFSSKREAEDQLMEEIDRELDRQKEKEDAKVVKSSK